MLTTFFNWLRRRAAESVLAGVNDAARQLESEGDDRAPLVLAWQGADDEKKLPEKKRGRETA